MPEVSRRVESTILVGDCRQRLSELPDESLDCCITDPPYGLSKEPDAAEVMKHWLAGDDYKHSSNGFMGKSWDSFVPGPATWKEVYRVLKPGAYLLCFSGTRTWDLMSMAIRLAGFENRDTISSFGGPPALAWAYGSGFPKSLSVEKAIDRMRNDDIRPVCRFLRAAIDASEHTPKTIAERFGFHPRMVEHWAARDTDSQPSVPKWDQWLQLKALLSLSDEMDAEVWRLNGRKGKPGDAWERREVLGESPHFSPGRREWNGEYVGGRPLDGTVDHRTITAPSTAQAKEWQGWGTALKPAWEVILVFRRPLSEKNVASQVLKTSTGALAIDRCRVGASGGGWNGLGDKTARAEGWGLNNPDGVQRNDGGRWPPNLLLSHVPPDENGNGGCRPTGEIRRVKGTAPRGEPSRGQPKAKTLIPYGGVNNNVHHADPDGYEGVEEVLCVEGCPVRLMDEQSGQTKSALRGKDYRTPKPGEVYGQYDVSPANPDNTYGDQGGSSRFFPRFPGFPSSLEPEAPFKYQAKASRRERNQGLPEGMTNHHSTVKPVMLMSWLCKLVAREGQTVLDPFMGSGSTGVAAVSLGLNFIGIEQDESYADVARHRISHAENSRQSGKVEKPAAPSQTPLDSLF